jgi:predicted DCC family thiol-disulfide oxidoreductase YuxK
MSASTSPAGTATIRVGGLAQADEALAAGRALVLFDGDCGLCHGSVRFILRNDPAGRFCYVRLESETGRALCRRYGVEHLAEGTFLLIDRSGVRMRSDAALAVAGELRWPWKALAGLRVVPKALRDWVYSAVARRRRWFGAPACALAPAWQRERIID